MKLKRICVYCGSSSGNNPQYRETTRQTGHALARRGIELVYGGGCVGLMGTIADAVLEARGHVIGIIPESLLAKEVGHRGLQDLRVVATMHERKTLMYELSDAFVALPGGFGTLEEFCEILTWAQLGLHWRPFGLLNIAGFYDPLLNFFDHAVAEGFVKSVHRSLIVADSDPDRLFDALGSIEIPKLDKWIR